MTMTDAEIRFLLTKQNVLTDLMRFNRAQAMQSADANTRMVCLERVRELETTAREAC